MSQPNEVNPPMTALLRRYATLTAAASMTREELEEQLHAEVWREDWEEVLRLLRLAQNGVSYGAAKECIARAVAAAPAEVVTALLAQLPDEEYAECDTYPVDWSPAGEVCRRLRWELDVQGTLVMHAVAANRPEILRLLLEHGYDVNCASGRAAAGLLKSFDACVSSYGRWFIPFDAYTARPENMVKLRKWEATPDDIAPMEWEGATPLALAVLMGHAECAGILVEHGAWLEEAPSVSSAMYLFWRTDDPNYQAARAKVLSTGSHERHRPVLWAVGRTCSPQQLKSVLESWPYEQGELTNAAAVMTRSLVYQRDFWKKEYRDGWRDLCRRIYRIGKICPESLQAREVIGGFLDYFFQWRDVDIELLLPFLEGATLDISEANSAGLYSLKYPAGRKTFLQIAEHCTLVMERDAVPAGIPEDILRLLIRHVHFLPPVPDRGVSSLTREILRTGDLRLIGRALKSGLVPPEESTEDLLRCQQSLRLPPVCRSALLTVQRPRRQEGGQQPRVVDISGRWFREKTTDEAMPILEDADWRSWFWPTLRHPFGRWTVQVMGREWTVNKAFFAACMEGRADIVEAWLPRMHESERRNTDTMLCGDTMTHVTMTPLCAAAFAGQTEIVKLLLDCGVPVQEEIFGRPSVWRGCWGDSDKEKALPMNPVLAAALDDHWETVKYLLGRGAVCDWEAAEVRHIWETVKEEELADAVKRYLRGG